jgi:hypothetical protein
MPDQPCHSVVDDEMPEREAAMNGCGADTPQIAVIDQRQAVKATLRRPPRWPRWPPFAMFCGK